MPGTYWFKARVDRSSTVNASVNSHEVVPCTIQLQGPLKLTGVNNWNAVAIRLVYIQRQQLTDNGLSKTTRVMTMNQSRKR